jgi:ornithine carbamoyltransferase
VHMTIACPQGYEPDVSVLQAARKDAAKSGVQLEVVEDPVEAVKGADAEGASFPALSGKY